METYGEFTADELACPLRLAVQTAAGRLAFAWDLDQNLPLTMHALRCGAITVSKARVIAEGTLGFDDDTRAAVEERALLKAERLTPGELRRVVARALIEIDPKGVEARRKDAVKRRIALIQPESNGTGTLRFIMSAEAAVGTWNGLSRLAEQARHEGDKRTLDQLRVDTMADLVRHAVECGCRDAACAVRVGSATTPRATKPLVHVTVAATTLAGADEAPGYLAGFGPITATLARLIARDAEWKRVFTDPDSGVVHDVGRAVYRPPAAMAEFVRTRDRTCRFPGCLQPASRCDLDHRIPFPKGPTATTNLHLLCRRHHRLKQSPRWRVDVDPDNPDQTRWVTPTGRVFATIPPCPDAAV